MVVSILTRVEDMLGRLEWLIADLKKKGAASKAEDVNGLSDRLDRVCARLEALETASGRPGAAAGKEFHEASSEGMSGLDRGIREAVDRIEDWIRRMTGEGAVCSGEDIKRLSELLDPLDTEGCDEEGAFRPEAKE